MPSTKSSILPRTWLKRVSPIKIGYPMKKNQTLKIVLISVGLAIFVDIFFARFIAAKLSTWPLLNRFQILNPQAPIVINTKEEVRVSETGDVIKTVNAVKSKISAVILKNDDRFAQVGTALNLTSDGLFLTLDSAIGEKQASQFLVKMDNGKSAEVAEIIKDPTTDLVVLRTTFSGVNVAELGESSQLVVGEKMILLSASLLDYAIRFQDAYVSTSQQESGLSQVSSDFPTRAYILDSKQADLPGQVVVNFKNKIVGIRDSKTLVSSDVIKNFVSRLLAEGDKISRPVFGFEYKTVSGVETLVFGMPSGAEVIKVNAGGPAQKTGLRAGDVITSVSAEGISAENPLETILEKYKPGDEIKLGIVRKEEVLELILAVGQLK